MSEQSRSVLQEWLANIPMMQQTVLLTAIRGPDGQPKYGAIKLLLRWYRRCIVLSAMDGKVLEDPLSPNGGSFTGPSIEPNTLFSTELPGPGEPVWKPMMDRHVSDYLRMLDSVPHHFHMHLMHAVEILGYKHPDPVIRKWWNSVYLRFVNDMHLNPETEAELDERLGDSRAGWLKRADPATAN